MKGRPKKEFTRNVTVKVRLSEQEDDILKKLCDTTGMTKSEVIRDCIWSFYEEVFCVEHLMEDYGNA